jgi:TPR repeat protein
MNIKSSFISALAVSLMLTTLTAHADFRKALDAYQKRDGATMLKEVKDAVESSNDDGLLLFLNALQIDEKTSKETSLHDTHQEKIDRSKMNSTFETILSESQQQEIKSLLNDVAKGSTADVQFRLHFMPKFTQTRGVNNRLIELENIAKKGSFSAAVELAQYYSYSSNVDYSREKAEDWFIKAAELNDPEYSFALAMRYLNYSTPNWASHEQCTAPDIKAVCFDKDEVKGFYWLERAAKSNDMNPRLLRRFAYEMGNIQLTNFKTKKPDSHQAYLWYLLGIKSPQPANIGPEDSVFIAALSKMYISGELKRVAPELDAIWKDTEKRDEFLYVKNITELPNFVSKARKENLEQKPIFSYEYNDSLHYYIDIYADGKVSLQLNNAAPESNRDVYWQVPPKKVQKFLKKIKQYDIENWHLNNPIKKENDSLCEGGASYCPTNDYIIRLYQGVHDRTIYFGDVRSSPQIDSKKFEHIAKVFALVEDYFPTQKLRCGLGNSKTFNQECIQQDNFKIQIAKKGVKK